MRGSERIVRELAFVLGLRELRLAVPELTLLVRHILPGEPDDLGERTMIRLDFRRDMPTLDKGRAEQYERVWGTRDVVLCLFLPVSWLSWRSAILGRGEQ